MTLDALLLLLVAAQAVFGGRALARMARSAGGRAIPALSRSETAPPTDGGAVSLVIPVLNEVARLAPCLDGVLAQGPELAEALVVDGGSTDGTQTLVARYAARDPRLRLVDASPVPGDWNGKPWGLQVGLERATPTTRWLLTLDADVRPSPTLARSLVAFAEARDEAALSVATRQELRGAGEGLLHPALLTTLIYRFGSPGRRARRVAEAQANGQCMLLRRDILARIGGFRQVRDSICEDITLARLLVAQGVPVGFYEAGDLISVRMYEGVGETWRNWTRSLPLRDRYARVSAWVGLIEVSLAQALPFPLLILLWLYGTLRGWSPLLLLALLVNGALAAARLGVLAGAARAYRTRPWTYWLSPLCDLPVAAQLWRSALRRRQVWRGRALLNAR